MHTHRDLEHVTGSWCSLVERQRERFVETIDRDELGREQLSFIESTLSAGMNFRKEHPELADRWLDVSFNEDGMTTLDMGGTQAFLNDVSVQQDEKIVVCGFTYFGNIAQIAHQIYLSVLHALPKSPYLVRKNHLYQIL